MQRTLAAESKLGWVSTDDPQTVLKTAGQASTTVHRRPLQIETEGLVSPHVRHCPPPSADVAVILAVSSAECVSASIAPARSKLVLYACVELETSKERRAGSSAVTPWPSE
jgi:hypothetical protein